MTKYALLFLGCLLPLPAIGAERDSSPLEIGAKFTATDTLACGEESDADCKECLANLSWKPTTFPVELEAAEAGCGDYLVRFPSPRPIGNAKNDRVAMEWFAAHDGDNKIKTARAVVVVHESGSRMTVGRIIARGISGQGLHAFLVQLPGYGSRHVAELETAEHTLPSMLQGIDDVRRARDAVAALPEVDHSLIGVQGTSLGGFVTATVAGLDHAYDRVFILLAGGNIQEVILHGARDAQKVHAKLAAAGITDDRIKEITRQVEPLRVAHRLRPESTWLYTGKFDTVVTPSCSLALEEAAHLPAGHHVEFPADHYSGIIYLPQVVEQIKQQMADTPTAIPAAGAAP